MGCGASKKAAKPQDRPADKQSEPSSSPAAAKPSKPPAPASEAETPAAAEQAGQCGVIVWSAEGLRDADLVGTSDAYCIARVGPAGSPWAEKPRSSGRRSATVYGSVDPEWRMGFVANLQGSTDPELQVRVYDKDFSSEDDFLGEASVTFAALKQADQPLKLDLRGERAKGSVRVSAGKDVLESNDIKPSALFEKLAPIGAMKQVKVEDVSAEGPLLIGTAPLPVTMRGVFWLSDQGRSSALASFAGPSKDGGGCSTGQLQGIRYTVRVSGDRVWAFADETQGNPKLAYAMDLIYHFVFNDAVEPTKCQIYPEFGRLGITQGPDTEWILDFEAELVGADEEFPGSVVWKRPSYILGKEMGTYALVQVMDESGKRIEPAWSKFAEYQNSDAAGPTPGTVFYREITA